MNSIDKSHANINSTNMFYDIINNHKNNEIQSTQKLVNESSHVTIYDNEWLETTKKYIIEIKSALNSSRDNRSLEIDMNNVNIYHINIQKLFNSLLDSIILKIQHILNVVDEEKFNNIIEQYQPLVQNAVLMKLKIKQTFSTKTFDIILKATDDIFNKLISIPFPN